MHWNHHVGWWLSHSKKDYQSDIPYFGRSHLGGKKKISFWSSITLMTRVTWVMAQCSGLVRSATKWAFGAKSLAGDILPGMNADTLTFPHWKTKSPPLQQPWVHFLGHHLRSFGFALFRDLAARFPQSISCSILQLDRDRTGWFSSTLHAYLAKHLGNSESELILPPPCRCFSHFLAQTYGFVGNLMDYCISLPHSVKISMYFPSLNYLATRRPWSFGIPSCLFSSSTCPKVPKSSKIQWLIVCPNQGSFQGFHKIFVHPILRLLFHGSFTVGRYPGFARSDLIYTPIPHPFFTRWLIRIPSSWIVTGNDNPQQTRYNPLY